MASVLTAAEARPSFGNEAVQAAPVEEDEEEYESDDEQELMLRRRLDKSEELIKQLKLIVKAQHAKIEELRNQLPETRGDIVRGIMAESEAKDIALLTSECNELRRKAGAFRADATKYKAENETLKKANRRLHAMLHESPGSKATSPRLQQLALMNSSQAPSESWSPADAVTSLGQASEQVAPSDTPCLGACASKRQSGQVGLSLRASVATEPPDEQYWPQSDSPPDSPTGHPSAERTKNRAMQKVGGNIPSFSRLAKLHSIMPNFWRRRLENPVAVLNGLADVAGRALTDGLVTVSVYVIDPWLRQHILSKSDGAERAVYYLGQSKTELHLLSQPGSKPEPPRFADFHELPLQSRTALAVVLQMPSSHRRLAVLQATPHPTAAKLAGPSASRPWRGRNFVSMSAPSDDQSPHPVGMPSSAKGSSRGGNVGADNLANGFTDSHFMCVQMLCGIAGGLLEQMERLSERETVLERMHDCVEAAVTITKARSIPDFEQRVKHAMSSFFGVNCVRVLFYDTEKEQLTLAAQLPLGGGAVQKTSPSFSADRGVVGLCVRYKKPVHIPDISEHPYVDNLADGLFERKMAKNGKPVQAHAEMLAGPMIVDFDDGGRIVGVVQMMERTKQKAKGGGNTAKAETPKEFSADEQSLFANLLRVCAHCLWRTIKVHDAQQKLTAATGEIDTRM